MGTNHDLVGFFCSHLTDLLWTPYKSQFWSRAPDFKRTYLRPQEELENVLIIQIEPKFSALSVYEVFRAIPALHPCQLAKNVKNNFFFVKYVVSGPSAWWILCTTKGQ